MAFKLNRYKPIPGIASGGKLKKSLKFKVQHKELGPGVMGEAYPNKVVIDKDIKPGTKQYEKVLRHEAQHVKDMQSGRASFGDDWVRWEGKTFARKDGKIKYNGTWKEEGDKSFPWEKSAQKAE
tara:strand:+ start:173 stop:544 length:372 start_codon:yes stop_codon:yes gene_type:complete